MAYEKSWWLPDEEGVGKTWRKMFNRYLKKPVTSDAVYHIILDEPELDENDKAYALPIEGGYLLHTEYGKQVYEVLSKLVTGPDLMHLNRLLLHDDIDSYYELNWFNLESLTLYGKRYASKIFRQVNNIRLLDIIDKLRKMYSLRNFKGAMLDNFLLRIMMTNLEIICDLRVLRSVALKTWGEQTQMSFWTKAEFGIIDKHFQDCVYALDTADSKKGVDPETVRFTRYGRDPVIGMNGTAILMRVFMTEFVWDFVDELLLYNRFKSIKGSAVCAECGQMFPKSFYGRNQLYCSSQCKRRAAKRRLRDKSRRRGMLIRQ